MASMALQMLAYFLGLLGFLGTAVATVMPQWRCSDYVGPNIITAMAYMKGLWMECVWNSAGIYQCEVHRSTLALPQDLQAARGLMLLSNLTSILAATLSAMGMECTRCLGHAPTKRTLTTAGGSCFVVAGLLCLVTVSWSTGEIIQSFSNPLLPGAMKFDIGQAIYVGFVSSSFSLVGGAMLCLSCAQAKKHFPELAESHDAFRMPTLGPFPPTVYQGSHGLSQCSASSSGYRLSDYV